jgi:hypothetical protein
LLSGISANPGKEAGFGDKGLNAGERLGDSVQEITATNTTQIGMTMAKK